MKKNYIAEARECARVYSTETLKKEIVLHEEAERRLKEEIDALTKKRYEVSADRLVLEIALSFREIHTRIYGEE